MPGSFDPYYTWLAIPPEEQPPHHYRLLGVRCFEDNADVIANAADRQMGHLRTYQAGKHGGLSQRLLNEVAAAKVCLLNPAKRAAYDEVLRRQLSAGGIAEAPPPAASDAPAEWAGLIDELQAAPGLSAAKVLPARNRRPGAPWLLGVAILLAAASVLAFFAFRPAGDTGLPEPTGKIARKKVAGLERADGPKEAAPKGPPGKELPKPPPTDTPKVQAPPPDVVSTPAPPPSQPAPAHQGENAAKPTEPEPPAPAPQAGPLRVQYKCGEPTRESNQIRMSLQIVNSGATAVPLSELKVRYWYTSDGNKPQRYWCDYTKIGSAHVAASFHKVARRWPTADSYLEITFAEGAGSIPPGESSGEIQNRAAKEDWSIYNHANDYSFDATKTSYADWPRVTLYRRGELVWGIEPGAKTGDR